jgi:hypothetical protein
MEDFDMGAMSFPEPPIPGVLELNIGDAWRGTWLQADSVPAGLPVHYAWAVVSDDDKNYVTRKKGDELFWLVEGDVPEGEKPEAYVKKLIAERTGIQANKIAVSGYLECEATGTNPKFAKGTLAARVLYTASTKAVKDVPATSGYERRRLRRNEFNVLMRQRYPELWRYISLATEKYIVMKARGEA